MLSLSCDTCLEQYQLTFSQLPELPAELTTLAKDQDTIGWQNCLEGKLPYSLYLFQELYLDTLETKRTITGWAAGLVDHILHITHMTWKHRCDVVHARELDGLKTTESNTLQDEIRAQFLLGHHNLQQEDHHLLKPGLEAILSLYLYGPEKKRGSTPFELHAQYTELNLLHFLTPFEVTALLMNSRVR
jgi:hypothetical protein